MILKDTFDIEPIEMFFVPIGEESFAYQAVCIGNKKYFVKYCEKPDIVRNIKLVNEFLYEMSDWNFVVAPVRTQTGETFAKLSGGVVSVFPFIEGVIIERGNHTFDKQLVDQLTNIMALVHTRKRVLVPLPRESFENTYNTQFIVIQSQVHKMETQNPLRELLYKHQKLLQQIIFSHDKQADSYKSHHPSFTLTHGDITGRNIIASPSGPKLVDWDGVMYAPPEKDFMFLRSNPFFSFDTYCEQVGKNFADIDYKLIEYYEQKWAIESILGNFQTLLSQPNLSTLDKQEYFEEIIKYLEDYS